MTKSSSCALLSIAGLHVFKEPLPGVTPHALHGASFQTEHLGRFFIRESGEVFALLQRAPPRLGFRELLQKPIDGDAQVQLDARGGKEVFDALERDEIRIGPPARVVNKVPTHSSSSYSEKMLPVPPISILGCNQTEINLVDQLGGLQGMTLALTLH